MCIPSEKTRLAGGWPHRYGRLFAMASNVSERKPHACFNPLPCTCCVGWLRPFPPTGETEVR